MLKMVIYESNRKMLKSWFCVLAGLLGLSINDINVYETKKDPAMVLLLDQDQTNRLTVHELIELLDHPDMKRKDLIELLQTWLDSRNR